MYIFINDKKTEVKESILLSELIEEMNIPEQGTAIALNDTLARRDNWSHITLQPNDKVLIISAAYGG